MRLLTQERKEGRRERGEREREKREKEEGRKEERRKKERKEERKRKKERRKKERKKGRRKKEKEEKKIWAGHYEIHLHNLHFERPRWVDHLRSGVQDQPVYGENPVFKKIQKVLGMVTNCYPSYSGRTGSRRIKLIDTTASVERHSGDFVSKKKSSSLK